MCGSVERDPKNSPPYAALGSCRDVLSRGKRVHLQVVQVEGTGPKNQSKGKAREPQYCTFSSRKVATLSNHSLKLANQLLFSSALVTMSRSSVSRSSSCTSSADMVDTEVVFCACEAVIEVIICEIRVTEDSKPGISVGGGTSST